MLTQWEKEEEEQSQNESTRNWDFWRKKGISPAGNRTPVSRVTGEDTHHYTTEDCGKFCVQTAIYALSFAYDHTTLNTPVLV